MSIHIGDRRGPYTVVSEGTFPYTWWVCDTYDPRARPILRTEIDLEKLAEVKP